jgi:hypothetical protein
MKELILVAIVLGAAIVFWRPPKRVRRLGADHLVSTGHAFLLIGALIALLFGARWLPVTEAVGPIVAFVAGWVGFATGIRFDRRLLRAVPIRALGFALAPAISAAIVVGAAGVAVLYLFGTPVAEATAGGLVLGAAAASSGPTLAAVLRTRRAGRSAQARSTLRMVELSAGIDDLVVLLFSMLAFALLRPGSDPVAPFWLVALSLLGSVVLGLTIWLFLGGRARQDERLLLGLAMIAFTAGFASWLHLSPAAVAAIAGMALVNLPGDRAALLVRTIRRVERMAVVILMTVIGLHAAGVRGWAVVALIACMTLLRFGAKHVAGEAVSRPIPGAPGLLATSRWTYGLVPQGTLGLVIALSFFHVWRDASSLAVLAAVAASSLLNELYSPWLLLALVRRVTASAQPRSGDAT